MRNLNFAEIGGRIRKQREFLGLTREYMAEKLDVSTKFCSDIELGKSGMSLKTLVTFSEILKLSTDYILFGQTDETSPEPLMNMIKSCPPKKLIFAEDILKTFLMSCE